MDNEEDPMMSKAAESDKQETAAETEEPENPDLDCCCCICECSNPDTRKKSCCCCFPIKCGLVTVGVIYAFLTVSLFILLFYGFINELLHWWYPVVGILLLVP